MSTKTVETILLPEVQAAQQGLEAGIRAQRIVYGGTEQCKPPNVQRPLLIRPLEPKQRQVLFAQPGVSSHKMEQENIPAFRDCFQFFEDCQGLAGKRLAPFLRLSLPGAEARPIEILRALQVLVVINLHRLLEN